MNKEQGSDTAMVPVSERALDFDEYSNLCADLCERVLAGNGFTWDDAADVLFGPEPEVTYTRWSA